MPKSFQNTGVMEGGISDHHALIFWQGYEEIIWVNLLLQKNLKWLALKKKANISNNPNIMKLYKKRKVMLLI